MQLRVLSEDDLVHIHQAALKVMEDTGVWFKECPEAHEIFERDGCKVENGRVQIPPGVVAEVLARVPDRRNLSAFFPGLGYAGLPGLGGRRHTSV